MPGGTHLGRVRPPAADGEPYVNARHAFKDAAQWGEVLADITRRLGLLYSAETDLSEKEAIAEIEEAYMADMGATVVAAVKPAKKASARPKRKSPARAKTKKRATGSKRSPRSRR